MESGALDFAANYKLLNDNLLDFSHLPYVHRGSFGGGADSAYDRPKVTALGRGVRIQRWIAGRVGERAATTAAYGIADTWQSYDFLIPGILILRSEVWPAGTAKASPDAPPTGLPLGSRMSCQAVTPLSERQTRYFFAGGPDAATCTPESRDHFMAISRTAFAEDKDMIQAQQTNIDLGGTPPVMPTTADSAIILFDRIASKFIN